MTRLFVALFALAVVGTRPAYAVTYTVDTVADITDPNDGVTSLREALVKVIQGDLVVFDAVVFPVGGATIFLSTPLPDIAADVAIDGDLRATLRPLSGYPTGAAALVLAGGNDVDGMVVAGFPADGIAVDGVTLPTSVGSTNGNLIYDNEGAGIRISNVVDLHVVTVQNNTIGANTLGVVEGNCALPVGACAGILVDPTVTQGVIIDDNVVVGTLGDPALSQGAGILLSGGDLNLVRRNSLGMILTIQAGNTGSGVVVVGANVPNALIEDNVISANGYNGILLET